jgi:hypothetical protein
MNETNDHTLHHILIAIVWFTLGWASSWLVEVWCRNRTKNNPFKRKE